MTGAFDCRQRKSFAQHEADKPLRPAKAQEPCNVGLFSDESRQIDLVDIVRKLPCPQPTRD